LTGPLLDEGGFLKLFKPLPFVLFDLVRERRPVALDQAGGGDAPG
jgi:hypothetical protein